MEKEKPIYWVGSSLKDLLALPDEVKREAGYQLHRVQNGLEPENWKPFQEVGSGVKEIRIYDQNGAYRVMYVANFQRKFMCFMLFKKRLKKRIKMILILLKLDTKQYRMRRNDE